MKITLIVLCTVLMVCVSGYGLGVRTDDVNADAVGVGKNVSAQTLVLETDEGNVAAGSADASEGIVRSQSRSSHGTLIARN